MKSLIQIKSLANTYMEICWTHWLWTCAMHVLCFDCHEVDGLTLPLHIFIVLFFNFFQFCNCKTSSLSASASHICFSPRTLQTRNPNPLHSLSSVAFVVPTTGSSTVCGTSGLRSSCNLRSSLRRCPRPSFSVWLPCLPLPSPNL